MSNEVRSKIAEIAARPGMWTLQDSFAEGCALLTGMNVASGGVMLSGFREWLHDEHGARLELAWPEHVLRAVGLRGSSVSRLDAAEQELAWRTLFSLVDQFLALDESAHRVEWFDSAAIGED